MAKHQDSSLLDVSAKSERHIKPFIRDMEGGSLGGRRKKRNSSYHSPKLEETASANSGQSESIDLEPKYNERLPEAQRGTHTSKSSQQTKEAHLRALLSFPESSSLKEKFVRKRPTEQPAKAVVLQGSAGKSAHQQTKFLKFVAVTQTGTLNSVEKAARGIYTNSEMSSNSQIGSTRAQLNRKEAVFQSRIDSVPLSRTSSSQRD